MAQKRECERSVAEVEADFDASWEQAYAEHKIELRDIFILKQLAGIRLVLKEWLEYSKQRERNYE